MSETTNSIEGFRRWIDERNGNRLFFFAIIAFLATAWTFGYWYLELQNVKTLVSQKGSEAFKIKCGYDFNQSGLPILLGWNQSAAANLTTNAKHDASPS